MCLYYLFYLTLYVTTTRSVISEISHSLWVLWSFSPDVISDNALWALQGSMIYSTENTVYGTHFFIWGSVYELTKRFQTYIIIHNDNFIITLLTHYQTPHTI